MKKLFALLLSFVFLFGCTESAADLKEKFPEYYDLDTFKGIEVYIWENDSGEYECVAMMGTNRNKTYEEISDLSKKPATAEQMKAILSSYDIAREEIIIIPIRLGESDFEIVSADFDRMNEIFWNTDGLQTRRDIDSADEINDVFGPIKYTCELSNYPLDKANIHDGEILLVEEDRLLVSPGGKSAKKEFGEVVWLICDEAFAYSKGQYVTYYFNDVKAPLSEGEPLRIIATTVCIP